MIFFYNEKTFEYLYQAEETPHSFFEVNGYKGCLKRIENGDKVVEQLIHFLESRSEVEDVYAKRLHDWDEKVKGKTIQKCDQFSQKVLFGKKLLTTFTNSPTRDHHGGRNQSSNAQSCARKTKK